MSTNNTNKIRHDPNSNYCVACGIEIPEGDMICNSCKKNCIDYLSKQDNENPVCIHEFELGAKKSLFHTRMSTNNFKKPIKTDIT